MRKADMRIGDGTIVSLFEQTKEEIVCPEFWEFKPFNGCRFDCQWCYLNGTYRFKKDERGVYTGKAPTYKKVEKIEEHLKKALKEIKKPTLFNAGEVSDALLFPWILEANIVPHFKEAFKKTGHKLLLLTKSTDISFLYRAKAQDCVVVAFSVNDEWVSGTWEHNAPHPWERLKAARKVADWGYPVRLRIDPMVPVEDWQHGYRKLLEKVMEYVPNAEVITLGSLRMMLTNLRVCQELCNDTSYTSYTTEKTSRDLRAPETIRIEMYRFMITELRKMGYKGHISICKETKSVWKKLSTPVMDGKKVVQEALLPKPEKAICNCRLAPKEEKPRNKKGE